jgi:hypothetical protein
MSASVLDRARSKRCRAGGRSNVITPRVRSIRVRRFLTFKLCSAPRESEAGGRSEKSFSKKTTWPVSDTWQVRTRVRRCYVTRLFSVKIPATDFSGISDVGLEARVARMRGRIRGAERWNLAGRDDVHRNPDRSSRPAVLLYSSCSWLR